MSMQRLRKGSSTLCMFADGYSGKVGNKPINPNSSRAYDVPITCSDALYRNC